MRAVIFLCLQYCTQGGDTFSFSKKLAKRCISRKIEFHSIFERQNAKEGQARNYNCRFHPLLELTVPPFWQKHCITIWEDCKYLSKTMEIKIQPKLPLTKSSFGCIIISKGRLPVGAGNGQLNFNCYLKIAASAYYVGAVIFLLQRFCIQDRQPRQ